MQKYADLQFAFDNLPSICKFAEIRFAVAARAPIPAR
jgi:hypothetical protein